LFLDGFVDYEGNKSVAPDHKGVQPPYTPDPEKGAETGDEESGPLEDKRSGHSDGKIPVRRELSAPEDAVRLGPATNRMKKL
jgi:hypothetical protein